MKAKHIPCNTVKMLGIQTSNKRVKRGIFAQNNVL